MNFSSLQTSKGSLLGSCHEQYSLATMLRVAFELEAEGLSEELKLTTPSIEAIKCALQAIEDQTAAFGWSRILLPIASQLSLPQSAA